VCVLYCGKQTWRCSPLNTFNTVFKCTVYQTSNAYTVVMLQLASQRAIAIAASCRHAECQTLFLQCFTYAHHVTLFLSVISLLHLSRWRLGWHGLPLQIKFLPLCRGRISHTTPTPASNVTIFRHIARPIMLCLVSLRLSAAVLLFK